MTTTYRTHTCGQLTKADVGKQVKLSGWMFRRRDHGGVVFVDLRDNADITQVVFHPDVAGAELIDQVTHMSLETVLCVSGKVVAREAEQVNPAMATGEIEVDVTTLEVLGPVDGGLPYALEDASIPEELRLKHRYLDMRTAGTAAVLDLRCQVIRAMREAMWAEDFREFTTPILTASSPEGARDFLVPSRLHPGKFYALPQAPQQFKQLLMAGGVDKYFQIAPCFRDEDPRADRHPLDFYQLDFEMSFATQDDVFALAEKVVGGVFEQFANWGGHSRTVEKAPWPRIPYAEAMLKYGSDKPDLRNPIEVIDVCDDWLATDFAVFKGIINDGGAVRAIPAPAAAVQPRSWFDKLGSWAQGELGAPAAPGYISWTAEGLKGPLLKFLGEDTARDIFRRCGLGEGDVVFFVASKGQMLFKLVSNLRDRIGADLNLLEENIFRLCWVVDYPMYERDEDTGKIDFSHNPFSMPQGGMDALNGPDPLAICAHQYDLVCNGYELASGAIRNHRPDVMIKAFEIAGYTEAAIAEQFGGLYKAFKHGVPPHGGMAPGIERIIMLLAGTANIRDVIPFPANGQGQDLLMAAPSAVSAEQLAELGIRLSPDVLRTQEQAAKAG